MKEKSKLSAAEKIRLYKRFNHDPDEIPEKNHQGGKLLPSIREQEAGGGGGLINAGKKVEPTISVGGTFAGTATKAGASTGKAIGWMIGKTNEDQQSDDPHKGTVSPGGLRRSTREAGVRVVEKVVGRRKSKKSLLLLPQKKLKSGKETVVKPPFQMAKHMWQLHRFKHMTNPMFVMSRKRWFDRLLIILGRIGGAVAIKSNPVGWLASMAGLLVVPLLLSGFAFMVLAGSASRMGSEYLSSKEMLIAMNQSYTTRELNLLNEIKRIKENRPGYDEYKVEVDGTIGHDPHVLLSFIAVMKGVVTDLSQVDGDIGSLFYIIHQTSYKETVRDDGKKVMTLRVTVKDLPTWIKQNLDKSSFKMYQSLLENQGGYPDLFTQPTLPADSGTYQYQQGGNLPPPDAGHVARVNGGWPGQCTWYVYNRFSQLGHPIAHSPMGNGGEWGVYARGYGYPVSHVAKAGTALCFPPGVAGADLTYGHIAFCERVNADGSVYLTEMNVKGEFIISDRTITAAEAAQCWYIDFGLKVE